MGREAGGEAQRGRAALLEHRPTGPATTPPEHTDAAVHSEPDDDGRRRPVVIEGSEHEILCGSVIAAVGQRGICEELHRADMMAPDRVRTEWDSMRTSDPMVFAAGDGAFGGSTIVMAMQHGQRAAYYLRHFLEGNRDPLPYRTPYRTRRVPVAQDLMWEKFPIQDPVFCGLGERPGRGVRHLVLEPGVDLVLRVVESAREERGERKLRIDDEPASAVRGLAHQVDEAPDDALARVRAMDGTELGGGGHETARHVFPLCR